MRNVYRNDNFCKNSSEISLMFKMQMSVDPQPNVKNKFIQILWHVCIESDSLEFLFLQSFVGLYLWNDQEFKIVEEVWPTGRPTDLQNATEYYIPSVEEITLRLIDKVRVNQDLAGCTITFDNYYTSFSLAKKMMVRGISCIGKFRTITQ